MGTHTAAITLSAVTFSVAGRGEIEVPTLEITWEDEPRLSFTVGVETLAALIEDHAFGLDAAPPGTLESLDPRREAALSVSVRPETLAMLGDPHGADELAGALFDAPPALWTDAGFVAREVSQELVAGKARWRIPIPAAG